MVQWEYRVMPRTAKVSPFGGAEAVYELWEQQLNELGAEGWELVFTTFDNNANPKTYCFKRPKPE